MNEPSNLLNRSEAEMPAVVMAPGRAPSDRVHFERDRELIRRCLTGEQRAWNELVERYQRLVYAIPRRYGLNEPDAEEVMQNVFLIVYRHLGSLRDEMLLSAWLIRITARETMHYRRREPAHDELDEQLADEGEGAEERFARLEVAHRVRLALSRMGSPCRELLEASLGDAPPNYKILAAKLNCPVGSIGPTRARCFKKFEKILRTMGIDGVP